MSNQPGFTAAFDALKHFDTLPDSAYVRQPVVQAIFAISAATVWRRVNDGGIPKPVKLSDRVTAWNVGDLRTALKQKGKATDRTEG